MYLVNIIWPMPPEAVHDFVSLHWVALLEAHKHQVVEDAYRDQRDVHDIRQFHLEHVKEEFHGRAAMAAE
jgi:hypothetical protein